MTRLRDRLVTLTPQQVRVLMMLSEGLLNKQIAYELGVSEATIKAHVSAILQKLGVESRTQAVIAAAKIAGGQWRQGNAVEVAHVAPIHRCATAYSAAAPSAACATGRAGRAARPA